MSYISSTTTVAYVDATTVAKTIYLPSTFNIVGKLITLKDIYGSAQANAITVSTIGGDLFENGLVSYKINQNYGTAQFVAQKGRWYLLNAASGGTDTSTGISSLSTIVSYGLSSLIIAPGLSSLSSLIGYGLSSLIVDPGVSSLSSLIGYGLSSLVVNPGISSLSSIVSYGLSSLIVDPGISSLSSIVSYGLSSLIVDPGISSLSSIVSYGLSSLIVDPGISSLSSIVSYGLSSLIVDPGISSLSSIVSYGLSTLVVAPGISSLSSIVSYGLSSLITGGSGLSSLSSVISYGLSSLGTQGSSGVSSLSSIVSYGLSSLGLGSSSGVSSLSSIVSYGLSSLFINAGLSSFSSIIGSTFRTQTLYVSSNIGVRCNSPQYALDVNGSIQGKLASNSLGTFSQSNLGGPGILDANSATPDSYVDANYKLDYWIYRNIVAKPPAPTNLVATPTKSNIFVTWSNPLLYSIGLLNSYVPFITNLFVTLSNATNTVRQTINLSNQSNLPMYPFAVQGADFFNTGSFASNITLKSDLYAVQQTNTNISFANGPYNISVYFSNYNVNAGVPISYATLIGCNLLGAGVPSPPQSLAPTSQTLNTVTFTFTGPQFSDVDDTVNGAPLANYLLVSSNAAPWAPYPRRFGGGYDSNGPVSNTITHTGGTQTYQVTGLFPDNYYSGRIAIRNQLNTTYGPFFFATTFLKTELPSAPSRLTPGLLNSFTPNKATYTFTNSGVNACNRTNTSLSIFNQATMNSTPLRFQFTNLAIHTTQTPGVANTDIMRIIGSNSGGTTNFLSNGGFNDTANVTNTATIRVERSNVVDFYAGTAGYTGFYQKADYFVSFTTGLLSASQNAYNLYVTQSNLSNSPVTVTDTFNVDSLTGNPSITFLSNIGATGPVVNYITGVASCINGSIFSNFINITNLGNLYLPYASFGNYSLVVGGTTASVTTNLDSTNSSTTPIYNTANALYSSGVLPNPARIQSVITLNDATSTAFTPNTTSVVVRITASNLNSSVGPLSCNIRFAGTAPYYIDLPSLAVLANTGAASSSNGIRVTSGWETSVPSVFGNTFVQSVSLVGAYSNELQLRNGLYVTKVGGFADYSSYYSNAGVNYSGVASDSTLRFATFKYSVSFASPTPVGTIGLRINYTGGTTFAYGGGIFTGGVVFQYKVNAYTNNAGTAYTATPNTNPTSENQTTVWLDGNANVVAGFTANSYDINGTPGIDTTKANSVSDRYLLVRPGNYSNFDLYIRVGIPMNQSYSFKYVSIFGYF